MRLADEAHSLGGSTPADSYLDIAKIIAVAEKSGADSVHPGYGFLAENAEFAQAVIDAGLIWIGPPPAAIEALGDKAKAKHIADKANAPLAPGTKDPVKDADEVVAFAEGERAAGRDQGRLRRRRSRPQGRPHARGDPRRLRVGGPRGGHGVRPRRVPRREVPRQAAPRRDPVPRRPARQRRRGLHPRLLAAAPQPEARRGGARAVPHRRPGRPSSTSRRRRSCARPATTAPAPASSWSPRTAPSRSSRSTPASRSSTASPRRSPASTWSARCSASPPARSSATTTRRSAATRSSTASTPRTAAATSCPPPAPSPRGARRSGPGVRLDGGYENGETIPGSFDSLIAKLIVTGRDRTQALERSRRALDEFVVDGMPTVIPFHRAVVATRRSSATATTFGVYTQWIETDFDNQITPYAGELGRGRRGRRAPDRGRRGRRQAARGRRCPAGSAGWPPARRGGREEAEARGRQEGRRRRQRRRRHQPDAGHHRQDRRRGGSGGRRGRHRGRHRGDEDGAAAQGPQGRHRHRAPGRGRRRPSPTARSSAKCCKD